VDQAEERLTGGNVSDAVVRVGNTVRKPATAATPAIDAFLRHLQVTGFDGAPRSFGVDDRGRHVVEFVPGEMVMGGPPLTLEELARVGGILRRLHDAAASFIPPQDAAWDVAIPPDREELICHHDLAPWNLVVDWDRDRWVFIDWDGSGPGSRLWDFAYSCKGFVPLNPDGDPAADAPRLRAIVDGYGLDDASRRDLVGKIVGHSRGMYDLLVEGARTGRQPWARLHAEGHADHWGPATDYVAHHADFFTATLF
jgi:hypothetical protein